MHRLLFPLLLASPSALAINITLDYSYSFGTFQEGTAQRASLEQAAADLSAVLTPGQLAAVPSRFGEYGFGYYNNGEFDLDSSARAHASYVIASPHDGSILRLVDETFGEDEFRIFVGRKQFPGGQVAGTTSLEIGLGISGLGYQISWQAAIDAAALNGTQLFGRGSNIVAQSINGSTPLGTVEGNYTVNFAPMAASVWIASDGVTPWQLDHTADVGAAQYDLYTVALNQMMIALGAIPPAENQPGVRTGITEAHLDALRDAGWSVIPEPASATLLLFGLSLAGMRRSRLQPL